MCRVVRAISNPNPLAANRMLCTAGKIVAARSVILISELTFGFSLPLHL